MIIIGKVINHVIIKPQREYRNYFWPIKYCFQARLLGDGGNRSGEVGKPDPSADTYAFHSDL